MFQLCLTRTKIQIRFNILIVMELRNSKCYISENIYHLSTQKHKNMYGVLFQKLTFFTMTLKALNWRRKRLFRAFCSSTGSNYYKIMNTIQATTKISGRSYELVRVFPIKCVFFGHIESKCFLCACCFIILIAIGFLYIIVLLNVSLIRMFGNIHALFYRESCICPAKIFAYNWTKATKTTAKL